MGEDTAHYISVPSLIKEYHCFDIAEVGVWRGELTEAVLAACGDQLKSYYLVDSWRPFVSDSVHFNQEQFQTMEIWDDYYSKVWQQFSKRCRILRLPSVEAAKLFSPKSLDFVFVDANHTREDVADDIAAWLPTLRETGILAGHDYGHSRFPGVAQAVHEAFPGDDLVQCMPGRLWFVELSSLGG